MLKLLFTNDFCIENKGYRESYITKLENTIIKYNSELLRGVTYVDDDTYNNCIELLTMLKPNSPVLSNDKPVIFVKDINEETIREIEPKVLDMEVLKFYLNPQGLNVRLVYEYGELVDAFTIGRSFKNNDFLNLMTELLTNRNEYLVDMEYVEVEGVIVLPTDNINMIRDLCYIKNTYQGLFSYINYSENVEDEKNENLEDVIHFIATDIYVKGIPFESVNNKYEMLESYEFLVPNFFEVERSGNFVYDLESAIYQAEDLKMMYDYTTDGIRLLTNTEDIIILKAGSWKIKTFKGYVKEIKWCESKCKKVPKLVFEYPIKIEDSFEISEFVLNSINLLLILDINIDEEITFAYFGDMGVLPITKNNEIILN